MDAIVEGGTAVVTGGAGTSAGLGRALVKQLVAKGIHVAILDVDGAAAESLRDELRAEGAEVLAFRVDVTDPDSLRLAAAEVEAAYGACNLLCAHVGGGGQGAVTEIPLEEWRTAMEVMVVGTIATVHTFLPLLRSSTGPRRIVLTSSVAALAPGRYQGPYRAAKAAVTSLGETLALELAPEGIDTTIAFPAGMLPAEAVDLARAALQGPAGDDEDIHLAIGREMAADAADIDTAETATTAIIDAVEAGRHYIVTHGVSATDRAGRRHRLLDEALADAQRRSTTSTGARE